MGERWNEKLRKLREMLIGKARPIQVQPKRRWSGPAVLPSDWYDSERQEFLGPQCYECHHNIPLGKALDEHGLCATCAPIPLEPRRRQSGGHDQPPAA
jgi:hypothetical protein